MIIVSQVMTTEVVTASPADTVDGALALMGDLGFRHLPVIDGTRRLLGVVSDRGLYAAIAADPTARGATLGSLLVGDPFVAVPGMRLTVLVDRMLALGLRTVPVVDDDRRLLGVVSYVDVLRGLQEVRATAGAGPAFGAERVLVPVGGDDRAMTALRLATQVFGAAEVHALHVLPVPTTMMPGGLARVDTPVRVQHSKDTLKRRIAEHHIEAPSHVVVRLGGAASEICDYAEEVGCDLVIMPSRERSGVRRVLLGSVTEYVIRHSPCPVLILRGNLPTAWTLYEQSNG